MNINFITLLYRQNLINFIIIIVKNVYTTILKLKSVAMRFVAFVCHFLRIKKYWKISNFSDLIPSDGNYYISFKDIYKKETDEKYHSSLRNKSNNKNTESNDSQLKPT